MSNNNSMKLQPLGLGLALGIVFSLGVFFTEFFSIFGLGVRFAKTFSEIMGLNISTFRGICLATFWVFIFAFIHGILIAFFYNLIIQKKNSR